MSLKNRIFCILVYAILSLNPIQAHTIDDLLKPIIPVGYNFFDGSKNIKFWGVNVNLQPWHDRNSVERMISRIKDMGFNSIRLWPNWSTLYNIDVRNSKSAPPQGFEIYEYTKGDGSYIDVFDYLVYLCRKNNIYIYMTALMYYPPVYSSFGNINDVNYDDWKKSIDNKDRWSGGVYDQWWAYVYFDKQIQSIWLKHAVKFLNHTNKYTNLKYANDNIIAMWQLHNESKFIDYFILKNKFNQGKYKFDDYHSRELQRLFVDYLTKNNKVSSIYKHCGHTISTIKSGIFNLNNQPSCLLASNLFIEFIIDLVNTWNLKFLEVVRSQAIEGQGISVTSISTDTFDYSSLSRFYTMQTGSAISLGTYPNPFTPDDQIRLKSQDKRWAPLDLFVTNNKPNIIYEVNHNKNTPFDTQLPWMLALFSNIQNINAIFYYFWNAPRNNELDKAYGEIEFTERGKEIWGDVLLLSSMKLAGEAYLEGYLPKNNYPNKILLNIDNVSNVNKQNIHYKGIFYNNNKKINNRSIKNSIQDITINNGSVIEFSNFENLSIDDDADAVSFNQEKDGINTKLSEYLGQDNLRIDLPNIKAFIGFLNNDVLEFDDGITLKIHNLDALKSIKTNHRYILFALISDDGLPISLSDHMSMILHGHSYQNNSSVEYVKPEATLLLKENKLRDHIIYDFKFKIINKYKSISSYHIGNNDKYFISKIKTNFNLQ